MNDLVQAYKDECRRYKFYYSQFNKAWSERELLWDQLKNFRSIKYDIDRVQGSQDPSVIEEHKLEISDEIERVSKVIEGIMVKITNIESTVEMMDEELSQAVMNVYCQKTATLEKESQRLHMDRKTLERKINKEILRLPQRTLEKMLL